MKLTGGKKLPVFCVREGGFTFDRRLRYNGGTEREGGRSMEEIDWTAIKTEYCTTETSYRKLAEKYGVARTTLYRRAGAEEWPKLREQSKSNIEAKALASAEKEAASYRAELYALAGRVARELSDVTENHTMTELIGLGIKPRDITGAIKDLEDALHLRSAADIREQEARIKILTKQAEGDRGGEEVRVVLSPELEDFSK